MGKNCFRMACNTFQILIDILAVLYRLYSPFWNSFCPFISSHKTQILNHVQIYITYLNFQNNHETSLSNFQNLEIVDTTTGIDGDAMKLVLKTRNVETNTYHVSRNYPLVFLFGGVIMYASISYCRVITFRNRFIIRAGIYKCELHFLFLPELQRMPYFFLFTWNEISKLSFERWNEKRVMRCLYPERGKRSKENGIR